jgi:hypothetical protein
VRVLLVIDSLSVEGAERHLVDLARRLRDRGDTVVVACSVGGPGADELEAAGVSVEVLCRRLVKRRLSVAWAWRLRRLVTRFDPDVVHAHLHAASSAAALALVGTQRRLVITDQTEGPWRARLAGAISAWGVPEKGIEDFIDAMAALRGEDGNDAGGDPWATASSAAPWRGVASRSGSTAPSRSGASGRTRSASCASSTPWPSPRAPRAHP